MQKNQYHQKKTNNLPVEAAILIVKEICDAHIEGQYKIIVNKVEQFVGAKSLDGEIEHEWLLTEGMTGEALHCLAHAFCADVIVERDSIIYSRKRRYR